MPKKVLRFIIPFFLLKPINLFAGSSFTLQEEMRESGPWLRDTALIAVAGLLAGWPVLFAIYFFIGKKYCNQINAFNFAIKTTWKRIGSFLGAFVIGCFAYSIVIMLPGFIIYCFWYTLRGLPIDDDNIHILYWLYASVFVLSYITALVMTIKGTDLNLSGKT